MNSGSLIENGKLKVKNNSQFSTFNSQLPKGWEIKKLGEVGKVCMCKRILKKQTSETGDIPFYKIGTFGKKANAFISKEVYEEYRSKYSFPKKGDILISASGTIGRRVIYDGKPAYFQDSNIVWIDNDEKEVLNKYLYKFYGHCDWNPSKGATISRLYNDDLRNIPIPIPPLPEQKRIVAILDRAFEAIDQAKANAEQNLKNAKELFESYLQGVFENKGDDWVEKRFDEVCVLQRGFDLPTRLRNKGVFPLVSSNGITDYVDVWKIKSPGVSTGRSGTIGKVHFIEEDYWPLNTSLYIKEFHGNYEKFIYYFLRQFDLSRYASGAGVPTLNRNNVHSEKVYFPKSLETQKQIVQQLDALQAETKKLEAIYQQKIVDLEELKKSVLQKAFNGEL